MTSRDATVLLRWFRDSRDHLEQLSGGGWRLSSALFRTQELSVDDGALSSAQETADRNPDCGVASLPKRKLEELDLTLRAAPEASNPAHCLVIGITRGKAKRLRDSASIAVQLSSKQILAVADLADAGNNPGE